jgi:hypothetical protein
MGLLERVIRALLYLCVIAICFYLIVWVIGILGVSLPYMVINILKVMFVLIAILILVRLFYPVFQGQNWFG